MSGAWCAQAVRWLRANGHDLAGLTGQDARALAAVAHCWELYSVADDAGQHAVIDAVGALLAGMQRKYRPLAFELVAHAMDWSDRDRLRQIVMDRLAQVIAMAAGRS